MLKINSAYFFRYFGKIMDQIEVGEEVTVTRHQRPYVRLIPAEDTDTAAVARAISVTQLANNDKAVMSQARKGARILLTRYNRPFAWLLPPAEQSQEEQK